MSREGGASRGWLAVVLVGLIATGTAGLILLLVGLTPEPFDTLFDAPSAPDGADAVAGALEGRLLWGASVIGLVTASALVLGVTWRTLRPAGGPVLLEAGIVVAIAVVGVFVGFLFKELGPASVFFESFRPRVAWSMEAIVRVLDALTAAVLIALIGAFAVVVYSADGKPGAVHLRRLDTLLRVGAVSLVASVIEVYALYHWGSFFSDDQPALDRVAFGMAATAGLSYSVLLLALYWTATHTIGEASDLPETRAPRAAARQMLVTTTKLLTGASPVLAAVVVELLKATADKAGGS